MFRTSQRALSRRLALSTTLVLLVSPAVHAAGAPLLNVRCDVSRELDMDDNAVCAAHWKKTTGEDLMLNQPPGPQRGRLGQEIAARHPLGPRSAAVPTPAAKAFPKLGLFTVDEVFGGWKQAQADHFNDGASCDQIIAVAKKR